MRNFVGFLTILILLMATYNANAGVRFITDVPQNAVDTRSPNGSSSSQGGRDCRAAGYTITSCNNGKIAIGRCPYAGTYFKACCEKRYTSSKDFCLKRGKKASKDSCAGLHACE